MTEKVNIFDCDEISAQPGLDDSAAALCAMLEIDNQGDTYEKVVLFKVIGLSVVLVVAALTCFSPGEVGLAVSFISPILIGIAGDEMDDTFLEYGGLLGEQHSLNGGGTWDQVSTDLSIGLLETNYRLITCI